MPNSRDEVLKYLADLHSYYGKYHNHKEASAWAGLVLAVALLIQLVTAIDRGLARTCAMRAAAAIMVVVFVLAVLAYLLQQFSLLRRAADLAAASFALRSEIISNPLAPVDPARYALATPGGDAVQSSYVLPQEVLARADALGARGQGARRNLEAVAYVMLGIAGVFGVVRILVEP